ncbi:TolC family protein [Xenophilus sp.]|uniref:TolC family protein n=1 Tax=Xenophilus sp. TaxID=1873499 RepID=UPI0037DC9C4E
MPRIDRAAAALALACLVAACANTAPDLAPARADAPWQPPGAPPANGFVLPPQPALAELPPTPDIDPAHAYTLPELIDLAQRHHPATRIAWIDARNAALAAGAAQRSWLPQLSATVLAGYQRRRGSSEGRFLSVDDDARGHGAVGVLSLQWLLFDFGERAALAEGAEQGAVVAGIGFTAAHQQLIESVSLAYYAHGAARSRVGVAQRSLANSRQVLEAAQARQRQGIGTVIEVAQARQGVAQAELARVQAEGRARDAHHALVAAMGISPLAPLKVADAPAPALGRASEAPVERIVAEALARRPDVQAAHAALLASRAGAKAADAARLPKVFLAASASRSSGAASVAALPGIGQQGPALDLSGSGSGAGVFVGVTVPLFDGGTRETAQAQAAQRVDAAQARLDRARQQAVQQIVVAQDALRTALASAEAAEALQATAALTHDAALEAYRHGVGTITAVTLADTQMLQAGQALADARAAAQSAAVSLAFATGALGSAPR